MFPKERKATFHDLPTELIQNVTQFTDLKTFHQLLIFLGTQLPSFQFKRGTFLQIWTYLGNATYAVDQHPSSEMYPSHTHYVKFLGDLVPQKIGHEHHFKRNVLESCQVHLHQEHYSTTLHVPDVFQLIECELGKLMMNLERGS